MSRQSGSRQSSQVFGTKFPVLLCSSEAQRADLESRNALLQFDAVIKLATLKGNSLSLTIDEIKDLQRIVVQDVWTHGGVLRWDAVGITNTTHRPPCYEEVPTLLQEMCDYANSSTKGPMHVAAYLLWRCNWIHPFFDGNGRTSRAISYLAMCVGHNMILPGTVTVMDLLSQDKNGGYYGALDAADEELRKGKIDVSVMEELLTELLIKQLLTAV